MLLAVLSGCFALLVAVVGYLGNRITARAGLRANVLRLEAEAEARRQAEDAAESARLAARSERDNAELRAANERLAAERDRIRADHEALHTAHREEIARLRALLANREAAP